MTTYGKFLHHCDYIYASLVITTDKITKPLCGMQINFVSENYEACKPQSQIHAQITLQVTNVT